MITYAGIGARMTPPEVLQTMYLTAVYFARHGLLLRSGGEPTGADRAFENGARAHNGKVEIWTPDMINKPQAWFDMAQKFHPAWHLCSDFARRAHARNCPVVLGYNLDTPVDFIVCWTPGGRVTGGTGQALRVAEPHNIPVFNFALADGTNRLTQFIQNGYKL